MTKTEGGMKDFKVRICQFFIDFGERRMLNAKSAEAQIFWNNFSHFFVKL